MENEAKNRVKIDIAGTHFTVVSEEGEEYTRAVAEKLNEEIKNVRKAAPGLSLSAAVMLTALNLCDTMTKAEEDADRLRKQVREYLSEAEKYRSECSEMAAENAKLKRDIEIYRQRLGDKGRNSEPAPVSPAIRTVRKTNSEEAGDDSAESGIYFGKGNKKP